MSTNDLKQQKLRVIVNIVDDETKNQFLHEELMRFPEIINLVIQNEDDSENNCILFIVKQRVIDP